MIFRLRSTPTVSANTVRVDREKNIIHGLSVFQAHVEALGHNSMGDEITMAQVVKLGNSRPNGIKARFTHPGMSEDGTGRQVSQMRNFRIRNDRVIADSHMLDSARRSPVYHHDVVEYLMDFADESPEDMGMSIVAQANLVNVDEDGREWSTVKDVPDDVEFTNEFPILRIAQLSAADFVGDPAANRDGMFRQMYSGTTNMLADDMFNYLDLFIKEQGLSHKKAYQFAMRYFGARLNNNSKRAPNLSYVKVLNDLL